MSPTPGPVHLAILQTWNQSLGTTPIATITSCSPDLKSSCMTVPAFGRVENADLILPHIFITIHEMVTRIYLTLKLG